MHSSVDPNSPASPQLYPHLTPGTGQSLGIHSTLKDLPLYTFTVSADTTVRSLRQSFAQNPDLPGVLILQNSQHRLLSRWQFLDSLLCLDTILEDSRSDSAMASSAQWTLAHFLHQTARSALFLAAGTSILQGAQQALRRPQEQQNDPIVVHRNGQFYLLNAATLNLAHWQIRGIETQIRYERLQMQLLESEKMAALGRLVDGVAHEILDPVGFVWGNLGYIADYAEQQHQLLMAYEAAMPDPPEDIIELREAIEFDYLRSDLPAAIKSARGGAQRLRRLATSLQNFCHIDEVHPRPTDLNTLIDSTLRLLKSRLTTPINIERCYGQLPPVTCFAGQLSQVFMSIFTNALDALLAQAQLADYRSNNYGSSHYSSSDSSAHTSLPLEQKTPQITVTTSICEPQDHPGLDPEEDRWVSVIISDNGPGIPPEVQAQILESFSPTQRLRKETGLALSYQIVTAKHGGRFWLRSLYHPPAEASTTETDSSALGHEPSPTGTEFEILLPLHPKATDS